MRLVKLALLLAVCLLVVGPAVAQPPGGGRGGNILGMLADNKQLQDELKLTADQIEKIKAAMEKVRADLKDDFAKLGRDSGASREERMEAGKKVREATEKALADILKPDQTKRIEQIHLQMAGIRMYTEKKVQDALKLTDEQKEKIKTIADDTEKKGRELFEAAGDDRRAAFEKIQALRKEAMESITKTLTDEQKKAVKDLTGEPFQLQRRPGGGGGR
jgi:Spy/CpxP family protein refolding chaperone